MNDEKAIAAVIHAGLQSDEVTDFYTGDCRGCGECCSRFLPVSPFDRVRLEVYVRRNGIEPAEPRAEYDLLCPYLTDGRECAVYAARPEICCAYRCDRHMTFTSEERREMAENLRHLAIGHSIQYKEQFFDELAEVVVGFEDYHDFDVVLDKLADLIDPEGGDDD